MTVGARIQLRRDTAANWTSANPILALAEPGYEKDTGKEKRGDGVTAWNSLPYHTPGIGTSVPTQTGNSGKYLGTDGSTLSWGTPPGTALTPTAVKTANYTAAAGDLVPFDLSSGSKTLTLPSAPADKTRIAVKIVALLRGAALTIACGGSDVLNKTGGATSATVSLLNQAVELQYRTSGGIWYVTAGDAPLSQLDLRYGPISNPTFEVITLNDNFTRSDGALGSDPNSGYMWGASGVNPPTISSNKMVNPGGASTSYATFAIARPPKELWGTFSLAPGSGTNASSAGMVLATSSVAAQAPFNLVHPQFTQNGCSIQKFVNNVSTTIGTVNWTSGLAVDSTSLYTVGWRLLDANTLAIYGPDGKTYTVTDSDNNGDLGRMHGRYGFASIEPQDTNAPNGRWHQVWAVEPRSANPQREPIPRDLWLPDSSAAASFDRSLATSTQVSAPTSGTVYCSGVTLPAGVAINWAEFFSGNTAAGTPTHQWAVLMDLAGRVVAVSSDLTTTAWPASTAHRFTFTSQFTPGGPMAVWVGLCVVATTVPNLSGLATGSLTTASYGPNPCGVSSSGQTTPPAIGAFLNKPITPAGYPYCVVG